MLACFSSNTLDFSCSHEADKVQLSSTMPLASRFAAEDWQPSRADLKEEQLWDASWDDENLNDPISLQLREQLQQQQQQQQQQ